MLQQTGVKTVGPYFEKFLARWPDVDGARPRARSTTCCGCGPGSAIIRGRAICTPARSRCWRDHGGCFRTPRKACDRCRGSGLHRGRDRGDRVRSPDHAGRRQYRARGVAAVRGRGTAAAGKAADPATGDDVCSTAGDEKSRAGDSAQALMDLGSSICTPKKPACALCPLNDDCAARARGDQETFPRKAPKKTGALRRGAAFVVTRGDELLVRTPPEKGLLGGMTRSAGLGLARRAGRQGGAEAGADAERRRALASQGRRRHPRLHAFPAGACGLHREPFPRARVRRRACAGCRSRRSAVKRCRMSCAR